MLDSLSHPQALPDPDHSGHAWPDEGMRWVQEPRKHAPGLDSLLTWAFRAKASRIGFQTGHPVWVGIHGRNRQATHAALDEGEFSQIVNHLYGADGMARLQGGKDFDTAYAIPIDRSTRLRFRLNATPTRTARRDGGNIVLRPIADMPPSLAEQLVEPGILEGYRPQEGMVIVSGGTGSGKSTLIAGMTVAKLMDPDGHYNIVEGAAPVEYLLERVRGPSSTMNQTEIPRDLESFPLFIRGCMRREPTDIIVGECRDTETMGAAIQAAISGHVLTTTVHANDVPLTMQRIASLCAPPRARQSDLGHRAIAASGDQPEAGAVGGWAAHRAARVPGLRCRAANRVPAHRPGRLAGADAPRRRRAWAILRQSHRPGPHARPDYRADSVAHAEEHRMTGGVQTSRVRGIGGRR